MPNENMIVAASPRRTAPAFGVATPDAKRMSPDMPSTADPAAGAARGFEACRTHLAALRRGVDKASGKQETLDGLRTSIAAAEASLAALQAKAALRDQRENEVAASGRPDADLSKLGTQVVRESEALLGHLDTLQKAVEAHARELKPSLVKTVVATLAVVAAIVGGAFLFTPMGSLLMLAGIMAAVSTLGIGATVHLIRNICSSPRHYDDFRANQTRALDEIKGTVAPARNSAAGFLQQVISDSSWRGEADAPRASCELALSMGYAFAKDVLATRDDEGLTLLQHLVREGHLDNCQIVARCIRDCDFTPQQKRKLLDLSDMSLHGKALGGFDFSGFNLYRTDLSDTDCADAIFDGALLDFADLRGADFSGATFRGASMTNASCHGARFAGADLQFAQVHQIDEQGRIVDRHRLDGANVTGAHLPDDASMNQLAATTRIKRAWQQRAIVHGARSEIARRGGNKFYETHYESPYTNRDGLTVAGLRNFHYADKNLAKREGMPPTLSIYRRSSTMPFSHGRQIGDGGFNAIFQGPRGFVARVEKEYEPPMDYAASPAAYGDLPSFVTAIELLAGLSVSRHAGVDLMAAIGDPSVTLGTGAFRTACEDLDIAHSRGLYHRDIKPQNMTYRNGKTFFIDCDFMVAATGNSADLTPAGTPAYIPKSFVLLAPHFRVPNRGYPKLLKQMDDLAMLLTMMQTIQPRLVVQPGQFYDPAVSRPEREAWVQTNIKDEHQGAVMRFMDNPEQGLPSGSPLHTVLR